MSESQTDTESVRRVCLETRQLAEIRGFLAGRPERGGIMTLHSAYLDTADRRFRRAGYCLAIREDGARTEVVLAPMGGREEQPVLRARALLPGAQADTLLETCPGPLRAQVLAVAGRERLEEVLRLLEHRETYQLPPDDEWSGTITLVETMGPSARNGTPVRLARIELEFIGNEDGPPILELLQERFDLSAAPDSALETALASIGDSPPPPPELGNTAADRDATAEELAFATLRTHFARCLAHEPGARLGVNPKCLHDMRVAVRRMRAAMRIFRRFLPVGRRELGAELRWLGKALGGVRDLDVQLEWIHEWGRTLSPEERGGLRPVESAFRNARYGARREMLEALDSARNEDLVERFTAWLRRGPLSPPRRASRRIVDVAPRLLRRRLRKVRRAGRRIGPASPAAEYHELRILAKRARYALEFHVPVYGRPAREMVRRLAALQDLLGEHQDSAVFLDRMTAFVDHDAQGPASSSARALEQLRAAQRERGESLRRRFPAVFKDVQGRARKRLLRALRREDRWMRHLGDST